jgi:hypothetical protein
MATLLLRFQVYLRLSAKHYVNPPAKDGLQYSDDQKRYIKSILPETSPQQAGYDSASERKHNKADDMMTIMDRVPTLNACGREVPGQTNRKKK